MFAPAPRFRLLLITDPSSPALIAKTERALAGVERGRVALLIRRPGESDDDVTAIYSALLPACRDTDTRVLVHGRPELAHRLSASGVHVPEHGPGVAAAREIVGPKALVGCSRHDRHGLRTALADGAGYAILSPVRAVPGKGAPIGFQGLRETIAGCALPVFALGGIEPPDVPEVRAAGAVGCAAIRAVYGSDDPARVVAAFLEGWG